MKKKFEIFQSSFSISERPPISYKVREYLEDFIYQQVLLEKNIIINSKWNIQLVLAFLPETKRYKSEQISKPQKPIVVSNENIKIFEFLIPMKLIDKSENKYLRTIELMFEAISVFFTSSYKKVSPTEMKHLWTLIDLDYLLKLPYPSPLTEQKYQSDVLDENGNVRSIIQ
jgi:hypothetical protein